MSSLPRLLIDARRVGVATDPVSRYLKCLVSGLSLVAQESPLRFEPIFLVSRSEDSLTLGGFGTVLVGSRPNGFFEKLELKLIAKRLGAVLASHSQTFGRVNFPVVDLGLLEKSLMADVAQLLQSYALTADRYFLCLSGLKPQKNLNLLVSAYLKYFDLAEAEAWPLVLNVTEAELKSLVPRTNARILALGELPQSSLRILMQNAGAVVAPSLEGGRGMTAVDAACMGVPLVASKTQSYRTILSELFQGEVLWVPPHQEELWVKALQTASSGKGMLLGASMESRSLLLKKYSASRLGVELNQIYCELVGLEK